MTKHTFAMTKHTLPRFFELFGDREKMARSIFTKPFPLIDLTQYDDNDLAKHRLTAAMELTMKNVRLYRKLIDLKLFKKAIVDLAKKGYAEYIMATGTYLSLTASKTQQEDIMGIITQQLSDENNEKFMTIAEGWKEEGLQQGMQQGMQQGANKQRFEIARRMLKAGYASETINRFTDLPIDIISNTDRDG